MQKLENEILPYINKQNVKPRSCFISYAWGNEEHERWVEEFAKFLEKANITVLLDRWEHKKGGILNDFVKKIEHADYTIVVGTKNYLDKINKKYENREPIIKSEIYLIEYFIGYNAERNDKVIPIISEGTVEESLPFFLRPKVVSDKSIKKVNNILKDVLKKAR